MGNRQGGFEKMEKRGYKIVKKQQVERQGIFLTNFVMIKERQLD